MRVLFTGKSEARAETRERFNEVFKKYSESEKKKLKKKSHETQETIVVCYLISVVLSLSEICTLMLKFLKEQSSFLVLASESKTESQPRERHRR